MAERSLHADWIGLVQPQGLVVTARALDLAQIALVDGAEAQRVLAVLLETLPRKTAPRVAFERFALEYFGWPTDRLAGAEGGPAVPEALSLVLPTFHETLRPDFVLLSSETPLLLVVVVPAGADLDADFLPHDRAWPATPQQRLERLLLATQVPLGLLWNGAALRLVAQPPHELSGHLTWPLDACLETLNRPMAAALRTLLSDEVARRLPTDRRLGALVLESRRYQNTVSAALAEQVLGALVELLRGFEAADRLDPQRFMASTLRAGGAALYEGLLAAILRAIVVLFAEERGLMPDSPTYREHHGLLALFEQLREDAGRHPDTMDQRFGAWARLLVLYRLLFDGARHPRLSMPARQGDLFNPDRYPFLEGRPYGSLRVQGDRLEPPKVSDGVVYRVLERLLMLRGERLSYRTLDVEQIGAVYENVMGFRLVECPKATVSLGADLHLVSVPDLLEVAGAKRAEWLDKTHGIKLAAGLKVPVAAAASAEALLGALKPRFSELQPGLHPAGSWLLEPTEERRRSGSHYTPRQLTGPIVEKALRPVLAALGDRPLPAQIRGLRVCDPAMGSGAFLVEACRQLGAALAEAWKVHGEPPDLPVHEDRLQLAMREVAQTCLYGIDRNPVAVQLGKLSLWLATLAKDHPFTFLDHALRHGDSLVGLTRTNIQDFDWKEASQFALVRGMIGPKLTRAKALREQIQDLSGSDDVAQKKSLWQEASEALADVRLIGDAVVAAFFGAATDKLRRSGLAQWRQRVTEWIVTSGRPEVRADLVAQLDAVLVGQPRFHWEIEFPEVFVRTNGGFDAIVGNPPFLGGKRISTELGDGCRDWLGSLHDGASANCDLVGHFFRRAFVLLRTSGVLGLVATNTLAQGDTRESGLRWILGHGGTIVDAQRRFAWPGVAAVVVSIVHIRKGAALRQARLDGADVSRISAFLIPGDHDTTPPILSANGSRCFIGTYVLGMGFTFDDHSEEATPLSDMHRLITDQPLNRERIFPFIGGEELNTSPVQAHHRYIIDFEDMELDEASGWEDLIAIVRAKVLPERAGKPGSYSSKWWRFARRSQEGRLVCAPLRRVIANSQVSAHHVFAFQPTNRVFAHTLNIFAFDSDAALAVLQCRAHEVWAKFLASSLEDRTRYTPSDCFETFPFPKDWVTNEDLEAAGRAYDGYRGDLMVRLNLGMTATYNRFHNPADTHPDIERLRDFHAGLDRAVLAAYGWGDLDTTLDFHTEVDERVRLRWPDATRDEVIARLLALNAERSKPAGLGSGSGSGSGSGPPPAPRKPRQGGLGIVDTGLLKLMTRDDD